MPVLRLVESGRAGVSRVHRGQPRTMVVEILSDRPGTRIFVVESEDRLAYDRATRERSMEKTRAALDKLARRVARGQLKAPEKIGAAAARILARDRGQRYFAWRLAGGAFCFFEHPDLERQRAFDGKYVVSADESSLHPPDEVAGRSVVRPASERLRAHAFVGALAFLFDRTPRAGR